MITSMKSYNDTIVNRYRDLPACSAVPQRAAPPRTPLENCIRRISNPLKCFVKIPACLRIRLMAETLLGEGQFLQVKEGIEKSLKLQVYNSDTTFKEDVQHVKLNKHQ
jgi:hypothetical protein